MILLLGFAASTGGEAADDFSAPGTETQNAIDLFKAHSPALAGADSTLVFSVEEGKITDAGPKAAIQGALAKVKALAGSGSVGSVVGMTSGGTNEGVGDAGRWVRGWRAGWAAEAAEECVDDLDDDRRDAGVVDAVVPHDVDRMAADRKNGRLAGPRPVGLDLRGGEW